VPSNVIRSVNKLHNAAWPQGFQGLYPSGLISAFFLSEGGWPGTNGPSPVVWDAVQGLPLVVTGIGVQPAWVAGQGGAALYFSSGPYIEGSTFYTRALDPLTWVMWLIPGSTGCPLAKNDANSNNVGWLLATSNVSMQLLVEFTGPNLIYQANVPTNWVGNWHHVAIVYDNSATAANTKIYIDGVLMTTKSSQNGGGTHASEAGQQLRMGRTTGSFTGSSAGTWADGTLESAFMFNRQLSQTEIVDLYSASYRWYTVRKGYAIVQPSQSFTATAAAKAATLGRKIFTSIAAAAHTKAATLTALFIQVKSLTATAAQKAGSLTATRVPNKPFAAQMLQRSGTLGRKVFITLSATKHTCSGVLTTIKAASQTVFTATAHTKVGALNVQVDIGAQLAATAAQKQAKLTLAVQHGPLPPPVPTPAACPTVSTVISHVEQCENPGS
jgi:hypothetical protein